jgi:hypothetical protein
VTPGVLGNEAGGVSARLVTGPAHETLVFNSDGSLTYTPATGLAGSDSFTYQAASAQSVVSNAATASISVVTGSGGSTGGGTGTGSGGPLVGVTPELDSLLLFGNRVLRRSSVLVAAATRPVDRSAETEGK